ncbi:hypothetical protein ACFY74_11870 [Streptomyces massasporeus]
MTVEQLALGCEPDWDDEDDDQDDEPGPCHPTSAAKASPRSSSTP